MNNQWVTIRLPVNLKKNQIYFFILDGRNRFFHLVNIRVVKISLHFAKFNAFYRTNIIHMTISVSWKLNIVCIKCKVKNQCYLQQRWPHSYMYRVEFYSHVKTRFAWSRLLLRCIYMFTTTSLTPPRFIKVPVQCLNSERSCIWVSGVSNLPLHTATRHLWKLECFTPWKISLHITLLSYWRRYWSYWNNLVYISCSVDIWHRYS